MILGHHGLPGYRISPPLSVCYVRVVASARQQRWKQTQDLSAELRTEDLRQAALLVPPSAMREVQFEVPQVLCTLKE